MRVAVVGGGLAGLAAAIRLAGEGHRVSIFEKNAHLGGKMNVWQSKGYTFDMGPTIITMPAVLERLFASVGRRMDDYLQMVSLDPQWRTFFADGSRFDLYSSLEGATAEISRFAPGEMASYLQFLSYAHRMYDISDKWFFWKPWGFSQGRHGGEHTGAAESVAGGFYRPDDLDAPGDPQAFPRPSSGAVVRAFRSVCRLFSFPRACHSLPDTVGSDRVRMLVSDGRNRSHRTGIDTTLRRTGR